MRRITEQAKTFPETPIGRLQAFCDVPGRWTTGGTGPVNGVFTDELAIIISKGDQPTRKTRKLAQTSLIHFLKPDSLLREPWLVEDFTVTTLALDDQTSNALIEEHPMHVPFDGSTRLFPLLHCISDLTVEPKYYAKEKIDVTELSWREASAADINVFDTTISALVQMVEAESASRLA